MFSVNIKDIVKIKESFSSFSTKKIEEVQKIINKPKKEKLRFSMITKGPSRRQVLVLMSLSNLDKFIIYSNKHIANINSVLKGIKSDVIHSDSRELTIITNKVTFSLDLNTIKKYIKNIKTIDLNDIIIPRLSQSKLYLKILGIPYLIKNSNAPSYLIS